MLQQALLYILTFISGLFFGSFLNLVSDRVTKGEQILKGRSKCPHCKKPLDAKNLIPVVSYVLQKGKCDKCKKKLSLYYPFSEILTGVMFMGVAYFSRIFSATGVPSMVTFVYLLTVVSFYIILFLTDMKERLIPDKVVIPAIIFVLSFMILSAVVYFTMYYFQLKNDDFGKYLLEAGLLKIQIFNSLKTLGVLLLSSAGIAGFFAFLVWVTHGRGMGGGDIRLGILIGLFNGFPYNIIAIFAGFVIGALVSLVLVILKKKSFKDAVPFGPFLILGSVIAFVWGKFILQVYINLF